MFELVRIYRMAGVAVLACGLRVAADLLEPNSPLRRADRFDVFADLEPEDLVTPAQTPPGVPVVGGKVPGHDGHSLRPLTLAELRDRGWVRDWIRPN